MAFTKIAAAGIGSTETVTLHSLEVLNNATVGGVLTYEDVTNVDSIGIITARAGVLVGSGITLSSDGDVFFTGIATGNGSGLTAINASNIGSGTVPTARLGSGTASSSTFLRGDSTFQTVNTDLVSDTSPQLGGNLDVNTKNIVFGDSSDGTSDDVLKFGAGSDLSLFHNGTDSRIVNTTGDLSIRGNSLKLASTTGEEYVRCTADSSVILFFNNVAKFTTNVDGYRVDDDVKAQFGTGSDLTIYHDGNNSVIQNDTGDLYIQNDSSNTTSKVLIRSKAGENSINVNPNGAVELYHDNTQRFETVSEGFNLVHSTGNVQFHFNRIIANLDQSFFIDHTATGRDFQIRTSDSSGLDTTAIQILASGCVYNRCRSSGQANLTLRKQVTQADGVDYFQCRNQNNDLRMVIEGDGDVKNSNNSYGSTSDSKLKENIVDASSQWNDIKAIKVRNFNFIEDSEKTKMLGVVAQEIETVSAGLVNESIDRDPDTGVDLGTTTKNVKYSILYMKSVKALQEAMTRIETLESEVAALKG